MQDDPDLEAAYALQTPDDNRRLYAEWATTYDDEFAVDMDYMLPLHVAEAFASVGGQGPVIDLGAGTGLLGAALKTYVLFRMDKQKWTRQGGGTGGAIIALVSGHVTPELAYWVRSGEFVFIAILGGIGGVAGPFLGALMFQIIRGYAAVYAPETWHAVLGIMLLVIIFFAPAGLYGIVAGRSRPQREEGGR